MLKRSLTLLPVRRELYQSKLFFFLFLLSLAIFFAGSLISYCVIRANAFGGSIDYVPLEIPVSFWYSTALLVVVGVAMQLSVFFVRREKQVSFRRSLIVAGLGAIGFVILQSIGLVELVQAHFFGLRWIDQVVWDLLYVGLFACVCTSWVVCFSFCLSR